MSTQRLILAGILAAIITPVAWAAGEPSTKAEPAKTAAVEPSSIEIEKVEPLPLFPKPEAGQPLRQRAILRLKNTGGEQPAMARITVGQAAPYTQNIGPLTAGTNAWPILISDISEPTRLTVEILSGEGVKTLAKRELMWKPQKKWTIYNLTLSHEDLGYKTYPHRLRTENRHENLRLALKYCKETDGWDSDSKFRYQQEVAEPLTTFLSSVDNSVAEDLGRRVAEGRIGINALHTTVNSEQLSHECLARLFYLGRRHVCDLLGAPGGRTAIIDDVIGLTWPLATYCAEAGVPYFLHGHNTCGACRELDKGVAYWQGPSGDAQDKVLVRATSYGSFALNPPRLKNKGDTVEGLLKSYGWVGEPIEWAVVKAISDPNHYPHRWPYDVILSQDGGDFTMASLTRAEIVRDWNAKFAYPRMLTATMDMFFDEINRQVDKTKIKTFALDGNNQWADQDAADAKLLGEARKTGELIPTAEKFATIAAALTPGGYPWTDLYQAYHRLLQYHEHSNGSSCGAVGGTLGAQGYETEQVEDREMVEDSSHFAERALADGLGRIAGAILTPHKKTLVVFNPMNRMRTDVVQIEAGALRSGETVVDMATGQASAPQQYNGGGACFIATDVPSVGYKTYEIRPGSPVAQTSANALPSTSMENRFYRIAFDPVSGAITSLFDKELNVELVDQSAPYKFNEYLYERVETNDQTQGTSPSWHRVKSAQLSVSKSALAQQMTIVASAEGAKKIVQKVTLFDDVKRIDFSLALDKAPSDRTLEDYRINNMKGKEAAYLALPLAVPDFRIQQELPGAVVEPIRQQFNGTCTAYYAIRHFTDLSNDRFGVTVAPVESALVEYGRPRSCAMSRQLPNGESAFEKEMKVPDNSHVYLYLLNNMFTTNIRIDQRGPLSFSWSLRSHAGDWKAGKADEFGWDTHNPLIARVVKGPQTGVLPSGGHSFISVDQPNVVCTTLKPAEFNGNGFILRFVETQGRATTATAALSCVDSITSATETDLVENDKPMPLAITGGRSVKFSMRSFGVKTIRVLVAPDEKGLRVADLKAEAVSDMQVSLKWTADQKTARQISRYNVYRGTKEDCKPTLLNLVARVPNAEYLDQPQLHIGSWINNRLEPQTTYYYRIAAVDRGNNQGPLSAAVKVRTLKSSEKNMAPLRIESVKAILVSPLSSYNFVNLLWRTSCESDVSRYEIHRSTTQGFAPSEATRLAVFTDKDQRAYDHLMFADKTVAAATIYYYRICALDDAGRTGGFSDEVCVRTK